MIKCKNTIVCESLCNECKLEEDDTINKVTKVDGTKITIEPVKKDATSVPGVQNVKIIDTSKPNTLTRGPNGELILNKTALPSTGSTVSQNTQKPTTNTSSNTQNTTQPGNTTQPSGSNQTGTQPGTKDATSSSSNQSSTPKEKPISLGSLVRDVSNEETSFMDDLYKIIKFSGIEK